MKSISWEGHIINNKLENTTLNKNALDKFYEENNSHPVKVEMSRITDMIKHHQHKFYRGHLLPLINKELNGIDSDSESLHKDLKCRFLKYKINDLSDVKPHHKRNTLLCHEDNIGGEIVIVYTHCIPSSGDLTKSEAHQYLMDVWMFATTELEIGIDEKTNRSYIDYIDAYKVDLVKKTFSGVESEEKIKVVEV